MFTKKTRALSALLTVCMLISMLACFVVPASASGEYTPYVEGELYSATGLVDTTEMPSIQDYAKDGNYKVATRADIEKIAALVTSGNTLAGSTIYMAGDIDMGWKNFRGIGQKGKTFSGTFDGNGFVIENLAVVVPYAEHLGFFGDITNATIKNVGIASGFVSGYKTTGALVGFGNTMSTVHNCWNAATVFSSGGDSGGLVGALGGSTGSQLYNCYNLGAVYLGTYGGGLYGTSWTNYKMVVKNSYNYGVIIGATVASASQMPYIGLGRFRVNSGNTYASNVFDGSANNAYVEQALGFISTHDFIANNTTGATGPKSDDHAVKFSKANFTGTEILSRLNTSMDTAANPAGYTVKYEKVEGLGYPVLTYYKDGTPVVRRTAHTTENVGVNTLAEKSAFFKKYSENINAFDGTEAKNLGVIELSTPEDVLALAMMMSAHQNVNGKFRLEGMGVTKISFMNDIDMKNLVMFKDGAAVLDAYIPIGACPSANTNSSTAATITVPVEGNGHVLKNWHSYVESSIDNMDVVASLFVKTSGDCSITDLGLENAIAEYAVRDTQTGNYHARFGLLVGKLTKGTGNAALKNCWTTGKVIVHDAVGSSEGVRKSDFGALVARDISTAATISNCWADVDVVHKVYPEYTKASVIGYNGSADRNTNVFYVAQEDDVTIGSSLASQTAIDADGALEVAYALNQKGMKDSAGNAVYYKAGATGPVWATEATAARKLSLVYGGVEVGVYYANGGTANLDVPNVPGYDITEAGLAALGASEGKFTMPAADTEVEVKGYDVSELVTMLTLYKANEDYWAQYAKDDAEDITDTVLAVAEKVEKATENYLDKAAIAADVKALYDGYLAMDKTVPVPASYKNDEIKLSVGTIPAVSGVIGNAEVFPNVGIYNEADLNAAGANAGTFTATQKLHLMKDVTLSDGSTFTGIAKLKADFDGHNKTIRNFDATTRGFFHQFAGKTIENLKFDDCHAKASAGGSALFMGLQASNYRVQLRNIVIENSSYEIAVTGQAGFGIFRGNLNGNEDHTNITLRNCTVKGYGKEGRAVYAGVIINSGTFNLKNILVEGSANNSAYPGNSAEGQIGGYECGILFGRNNDGTAPTVNGTNIILINNTAKHSSTSGTSATESEGKVGALLNGDSRDGAKYTFTNVIAYNNAASDILARAEHLRYADATDAEGTVTLKNVYSDAKVVLEKYGYTDRKAIEKPALSATEHVAATPAQFKDGSAIYAVNKAAGSAIFAMDRNGKALFADANNAAPAKVVIEKEDKTNLLTFYTANDKKALGVEGSAIEAAATTDCKLSVDMTAAELAAAEFTADTTVTVYQHNLGFFSTVGEKIHYQGCANKCGKYTEVPGDCNDEGTVEGNAVVAPTEDAQGYTRHLCSVCDTEWYDNYTAKLTVIKVDKETAAVKDGETVTLAYSLKNDPGITSLTYKVTYDPAIFSVSGGANGVLTGTLNKGAADVFTVELPVTVIDGVMANAGSVSVEITAATAGETPVTVTGAATTAFTITNKLDVAKDELTKLVALYNKFRAYWDLTAAKDTLAAVEARLAGNTYVSVDVANADLKALFDLYVLDATQPVPVTYATEGLTLSVGTIPAFTKGAVIGDEDYLQVGIYNVDDLIYASMGDAEEWTTVEGVYNFPAKFSSKQTLNLMADLDLAGVTKFVRIHDLAAAFDGRNHTIENWSGTNVAGFFQFPKKSIKNLRFYNCTPTVAASGAMVVGQYWGSSQADALVENITIEKCTVSGNGTYVGSVVLGEARAIKQTLKNITIRDTKFTHTDSIAYVESSGLLIGRVREGATMTIENILIEGSENTNGSHDGVGLVFGIINHKALGSEASNKITIDGLILRNNKGTDIQAVLGGAWERKATTKPNSITLKNALIYGNDTGSAPLLSNFYPSEASLKDVATTMENVYTDVADTKYNTIDLKTNVVATSAFTSGAAVYAANKAEALFAVTADGKAIFADGQNAATKKVSFVEGEEEKLAYYTDNKGKLIGADAAAVAALTDCKILNGEGVDVLDTLDAELAKAFTADTAYTVLKHELVGVHTEGTHKHNVICENGCDYLEADVACADGEGYPKVVNPTEEAEGYTAHKCGMCGFEWNDTFVDKLVVLKGGEEAMALKNEEAYLKLRLANSDLLTAITMKVEFDADTFEYVGVNRDDVTVDTSEADEGILTVTSQNENGFTNWDGDLFAIIEFKVKTDAEAGDKELKASVTAAKKGETDVTVEGGVATTKVTVTKYMRGDVDQNGFVNPADITYMLRHFSGEDLLDETEKGLGDMDRNGTFSIVDALYLLRAQATNP